MTLIAPSLAEAFEYAKSGRHCMVKCPSHDDGTESLSVSPGNTQPVVMKCHADCQNEDILTAAGIDWNEMLNQDVDWQKAYEEDVKDLWTPAGPASHMYPYVDERGYPLFQVMRIPQGEGRKTFRQRRRGPDGKWVWKVDDTRRVLYRLPQVLACMNAGQEIWVVEGEKDVHTLVSLGVCATTNPMGAGGGKWQEEFSESLRGASVTIVADADDPGRAHARRVRDSLMEHDCMVRIVEAIPGLKDVTDHLAAGHTLAEMVETTPVESIRVDQGGVDVLELIQRKSADIEYVVPGIFARGDRLILTGFEGHGKSTFLRQMACQVAAGINPFTLEKCDPKRVLVIDMENHPDQVLTSWQDMVGLAARHDSPVEKGMLTILEEWNNDDLDLLMDSGFAWLQERVRAHMPDLVVMGPLTNMAGRDLKDDEVVRKIKKAVNAARSINGTVFVMEHHAPHKGPGDKERAVRPYGSSMFLKWPDFGYGFRPTGHNTWYEFQKTRFPRVRSRKFPEYMRNGTPNSDEWPWMPGSEADFEADGGQIK